VLASSKVASADDATAFFGTASAHDRHAPAATLCEHVIAADRPNRTTAFEPVTTDWRNSSFASAGREGKVRDKWVAWPIEWKCLIPRISFLPVASRDLLIALPTAGEIPSAT
jgi:hypothetical protein